MGAIHILPELILPIGGVIVMLAESFFRPHSSRTPLAWLAAIFALAATAASVWQLHMPPAEAYWGAVHTDAFSAILHILIALVALCTIVITPDYLERRHQTGEICALILFASTGMMFMTSAASLLLVFIGLEISSIASYVMTGLRKQYATGPEAAIKYFLLGSFATAFFLYGIALTFGATGTDNIYAIGASLAHAGPTALATVAMVLMLIGLGFKVSAAPFHVWTPDVYEGAPAPVVALMSTAPKAAAFAVLIRVLDISFPTLAAKWQISLWILAVASMTIGNVGALVQRNVKRMLAYSSIAHAGYMLVGIAAFSSTGVAAVTFYLLAYAAMNGGAFAVISYATRFEERGTSISDFAGLARRSPFVAAVFSILLLSLIGIPFTGGFFGKFYIFTAALHRDMVWLAVIGLLNSGIAAFYYLRVIAVMYTQPPDPSSALNLKPLRFGSAAVLTFAALATLFLGIVPGHVLRIARDASAGIWSAQTPSAQTPPAPAPTSSR